MYRIIQVFSLSEGRGGPNAAECSSNFFEIHLNDKRSNDSPPREREIRSEMPSSDAADKKSDTSGLRPTCIEKGGTSTRTRPCT
ncbi:hypothetical protein CEXT_216031 [Caerostris extrusa]|uniref:Uncharacterized protein n=1 Tax=Caerostris extrusa TaxID=172846 RepID=A0AAV4STG6_CAEEX|nr:hypothetical protein CEXT_216031 [Caerostris extrusa]